MHSLPALARRSGRSLLLCLALALSLASAARAQTAVDTDGDGVADALDCAPADARAAGQHRFYFDLDGDLSGNAGNPAVLCSATPFPGSTLWSGDPNDANAAERIAVVPRGARRLGLDFLDTAADGAWRPDLAAEIGADATTVQILWNQIETAPGQYNGPQMAVLDLVATLAQRGIAVNVTMSPISQTYLTVPADLAAGLQAGTMTFDHPTFIARFNIFMDVVRWKLQGVTVPSLQIGHEVDRYLTVRPDGAFWGQFFTFFSAARTHARELWPQVSVGITATSSGVTTAPFNGLMSVLNSSADHVSVTYLPRSATFENASAEAVKLQVEQVIAASYPKPVVFQSIAAPSAVNTLGSVATQAQFLEAFFAVWDQYATFVPFASVSRLFDWTKERAQAEAQSPHVAAGASLAAATGYFRSLGLRDHTGNAKAAYDTLRVLAMERGWQQAVPGTTRHTMLGFTPALYDREGTAIPEAVLANVMQRIGTSSDMVLFQFDGGVPWPEALNDTLSGPLPYSENVKETWQKYRDTRPGGSRLAVAINALGVPRWQLAPYWGVGEDFVFDEDFNPVGTGTMRDFENRLLPPEWRNKRWDDPMVMTAYTNYAKRVVQFFQPDYLLIGIEANLALEPDPAAYEHFVNLQRHVYQALKADPATANVTIMVSFVAEHLLVDRLGTHYLIDGVADPEALKQRHLAALAASAPYMDMVGFSMYPLKTHFGTARPPAPIFDHLVTAARTVTDKPFAITETGFPSKAFTVKNQTFQGSPAKQAGFYQLLLNEAEKYQFEFVTSFTPFDMTPFMDRLRAGAAQDPPTVDPGLVEFFKYFEFMGLFEIEGGVRPAGQLLLDFVTRPLQRSESWVAPVTLSSPSGTVTTTIGVGADGQLFYSVDRGGQPVIQPSPLGQIVDGVNLGTQITNIDLAAGPDVDESYPVNGVHATARNRYRPATLTIRRAPVSDRVVTIELRAFDDGIAYRYVTPGSGPRIIGGEASAWTLPQGSKVWHQVNTENYEANYRGTTLGLFNDDIGGPITAELAAGGYVLLTEAALRRYSGMTYDADLASTTLKGEFLDDASWTVTGGETSPWRVVVTTATLDALVNSDIVSNLNDGPSPALYPQGLKTWWIKPGRAVWSWWSDNTSGYRYDVQHDYVDLAHQLRTEYQVIDAGWESAFPFAGQDAFQRLSALVSYGRVQWRDVGLWVWKYWYELVDPAERQAFFHKVAEAGAVGVKIDNVYGYQSESFANVELTEAILKDAAAEHLLVNFHGIAKSTGLQRTYPNELTREGFMGLELNGLAWDQGLFVTPQHNAAVPFVRLVSGPGDYTPVTLDARKIGPTTFAHQVATAGLFTSPVQHWADNPEVLLQQPAAVELLRTLPVVWDETRVLAPSQIGELALMARRAAGRWYLFAINGDATTGRTLPAVALDFLGPGEWNASVIADGTKTSLAASTLSAVTSASSLAVSMLPGGGYTAVFSPAPIMTRRVKQGFSSIVPSFDGPGFQAGYTLLRDKADIVTHSFQEGVPWPQAYVSSDVSTYPVHMREYWNLLRAADDAVIPTVARYLMINPVATSTYSTLAPLLGEQDYMPLPPPWDTYEFNDPHVKQAFLNFAIAAIDFFHPAYVAVGIESNILLAKAPTKWAAYKELNAYLYDQLKQRYPALKVLATVHYEHMRGMFIESERLAEQARTIYPTVLEDEVKALLQHSDLFAISTYPYMVQNNPLIGPSTRLDMDYYDRAVAIGQATGKRLAIDQSGYITRDLLYGPENVTLPGSEERQRAYVERMLADAHVHDFEFAINFVGVDYGTNYGDAPSALIWAYTGLRRQDLSDKPAMGVWDAYRAEVTGLTVPPGGTPPVAPAPPSFLQLTERLSQGVTSGALAMPGSVTEPPSPELFIRWQQFASFLPTFVLPTTEDPTAPFAFADPYAAAARLTLARRALFQPYLDGLNALFESSGVFPLHMVPGNADLIYMLGDWVLLAPVVEEGANTRTLRLPADTMWRNFYTGQVLAGGQTIVADAPLDQMPIFIRIP